MGKVLSSNCKANTKLWMSDKYKETLNCTLSFSYIIGV